MSMMYVFNGTLPLWFATGLAYHMSPHPGTVATPMLDPTMIAPAIDRLGRTIGESIEHKFSELRLEQNSHHSEILDHIDGVGIAVEGMAEKRDEDVIMNKEEFQ